MTENVYCSIGYHVVDKYLSSLSFAFTHLLQVSSMHNFYHFISLSLLSSSAFSSTSYLEQICSPATLHSIGGEGREVALKTYIRSLSLYSLSSGYSTLLVNHSIVCLATSSTFTLAKLPWVDSFASDIAQCWGKVERWLWRSTQCHYHSILPLLAILLCQSIALWSA